MSSSAPLSLVLGTLPLGTPRIEIGLVFLVVRLPPLGPLFFTPLSPTGPSPPLTKLDMREHSNSRASTVQLYDKAPSFTPDPSPTRVRASQKGMVLCTLSASIIGLTVPCFDRPQPGNVPMYWPSIFERFAFSGLIFPPASLPLHSPLKDSRDHLVKTPNFDASPLPEE